MVKLILLADDIVTYARWLCRSWRKSNYHQRIAAVTLANYVISIGLSINSNRSETGNFGREGRLAKDGRLELGRAQIGYVNRLTR